MIFADFHLHSKYSRATSKQMMPGLIEKYAAVKGLNLLGTGDFTHPKYLELLKQTLREESGVLRTKENFPYILQGEISLMYKQGGKGRRVHHLLLAPDFAAVDQINAFLDTKGRRDYDGRPIFGFSSIELVEQMHSISTDIMVIPAHAWTPWFGVFGSKSGFDSLEECFQDQAKHIHAIETGMSSDPAMNWRLSQLDSVTLISNSDPHSPWPWRLGRECNVFDLPEDYTYRNIIDAIRNKDPRRFSFTVETDPSYGKYHWDGHRNCGVSMSPAESRSAGGICPKCNLPMTIGVESRVEQLADRAQGFVPKDSIPFRRLLPLSEIIAAVLGIKSLYSKAVATEHQKLIERFGNEFAILLNAPEEELKKVAKPKIVEYILKSREQKLNVIPGYDGTYGRLAVDGKE